MVNLSVVIVSFNSAKFIRSCLSAVRKQFKKKEDIEIVVVDNASTDKTVKDVRKNFPQVTLIENKKNLGFAKANNIGLKNTKGKYVLLLNPDTVIGKDTLKVMLEFMDINPRAAVATCRLELIDGTLDDACHRGFPTPWNAFCHFSGLAKIFPHSLLFNGYHLGYRQMEKVHEIDSCVGAFMLVRSSAGSRLGWFDEDYFWYGEDLDFCYRVKRTGLKTFYIPWVKTVHYKGISSGIKSHSRKHSSADENIRLMATKSRFEVMRIFYRKHYLKKYPSLITFLTLKFISLMEWFKLRVLN